MNLPTESAAQLKASPAGRGATLADQRVSPLANTDSLPSKNSAVHSDLPADGILIVDRAGQIRAVDGAMAAWYVKLELGPIRGQRITSLLDAEGLLAELEQVVEEETERTFSLKTPAAGPPISLRLRRLSAVEGPLVLVEFHRDMSARTSERRDPLTHLADRSAIAPCIDAWQQDAAPEVARFAVLFMDLDGFKRINDAHGHATGDLVLQTLAARWLGCVREGDLVARYGGDEFVALIKDATAITVEPVIRRLTLAASEPVPAGGQQVQVSVTIGVAASDSGDGPVAALLAAADHDMYERKRAARR